MERTNMRWLKVGRFLGAQTVAMLAGSAVAAWSATAWPDGVGAAAAQQIAVPPPARSTDALYKKTCSKCHDADGKGTSARDSMPEIPDFTSALWQQSRTGAQLIVSILDGKGARMPAFADRLGREKARELIHTIRRFGPPPATPVTASAAGDFTQRFQELQEEFERLRKQFHDLGTAGK
jgi:mono/diheme cytochrome c family protein